MSEKSKFNIYLCSGGLDKNAVVFHRETEQVFILPWPSVTGLFGLAPIFCNLSTELKISVNKFKLWQPSV